MNTLRWRRYAGRALIGAGLGLAAIHTASAGGYDTGERDWDFLFQTANYAAEAGVRYVDPQRTLKLARPARRALKRSFLREMCAQQRLLRPRTQLV